MQPLHHHDIYRTYILTTLHYHHQHHTAGHDLMGSFRSEQLFATRVAASRQMKGSAKLILVLPLPSLVTYVQGICQQNDILQSSDHIPGP